MTQSPMTQPPRILSYRRPLMSGGDVVEVQRRLVAHGFGTEADTDGLYGPGTRGRVRAFQAARGLGIDGKVGPATLAALRAAPPPAAAPAGAGTQLLPADWLPRCRMRRIITHWTGGGYQVSRLDRRHYHILIDGDGRVHRGLRSIADNVSTADGAYAAHTRACNTGSIGISVCAMAGAAERPFEPGPAPMTEMQWNRLAEVVAELCRAYAIACTPLTVLAHGEVEETLGIRQRGKWDPLVLPWRPALAKREVGTLFRARVEALLAGTTAADGGDETLPRQTALPDGPAANGPAADTPPAKIPAATAGDAAIVRAAGAVARLAPAWLADAGRETVRRSAEAILRAARDLGVRDPSHLAYMLATAEHESNLGRNMVERWGPSEAQRRYESSPLNGRPGDGRRFLGRGFVQITFRSNYARYTRILEQQGEPVDLLARPDDAADPGIAARILVTGMTREGFTSPDRLLSAYGVDGDFDFYRARDIVNGDKARPSGRYGGRRIGAGIAELAKAYREALLNAERSAGA